MTLTLSIGIPAYNEEKNMANLLDHLLAQVMPDGVELKEIIIVSSACTDGTGILYLNVDLHLAVVAFISLVPFLSLRAGGALYALHTRGSSSTSRARRPLATLGALWTGNTNQAIGTGGACRALKTLCCLSNIALS